MFKNMVAAVILCFAFSSTTFPVVGSAQDPDRGTTLVCVGAGGDALSLLEWTAEEVAEYEARTGQDVAEIAAHPKTGGCFDLAGLMGGWYPGTSWLCSRDSAGRWMGPSWIWSIYQRGDEVGPDPATGRCPEPWSPVQQASTELESGSATAVHLTELEVAGDYDRLYAWMHPDSQAVVPRAAMEGWYREVFALRPPVWMTVDDVRLVEWEWDVTGKVYPSAAEVTFRQRFSDGEVTEDFAHLVRDNGVWRWFFGSDRDFVDEQIAQFVGLQSTPDPTATPRPAPTTTAAPTALPLPTVAQSATGCQLVELNPGYPGYRGYVAGIDGPAEVACLEELIAANPRFDKAAEDAANLVATQTIGLAGSPADWTWENWMAIEAERGLPATCYSCLFRDPDAPNKRQSAAWDPADSRLRMGGYGTSEAIAQAAANAGMGPDESAFFLQEFDPNDEDELGPDRVLRAFVGMMWPGHHTAPEMLSAYDELFALLADPGTAFFDAALMWDTVLAQGGYAPTPPTAHVEDQLYMVRTSLEALCYTGFCDLYWYDQIIKPGYLNEIRTSGRNISLRDWLREEFGNPLSDP